MEGSKEELNFYNSVTRFLTPCCDKSVTKRVRWVIRQANLIDIVSACFLRSGPYHKAVSDPDPDKPIFANSAGGPMDAPNMVKREFEPSFLYRDR